ncbi:hypothetical protein N9M10_02335 [Hellea sp.]|nr:hypothetical protein [Hellea sp.]
MAEDRTIMANERVTRGSILILASFMVAGAVMLIFAVWTVSWTS